MISKEDREGRFALRHPKRRSLGRVLAILCGGTVLICAGAVALLAGSVDRAEANLPPAASPQSKVSAASWIEVNRPFTMFDLSGGDFAKLPLRYSARRDETGSARQDTLAYGMPKPGEPYLRIMFYRTGAEPIVETTLFVDMARLAAEAGLAVTRNGRPTLVDTRFGVFEVSDVTVAGKGPAATCLGFRHARGSSNEPLTISGLACGSAAKPIDRAALACTLDRIDLVSAGDDLQLQTVFVEAERRRGPGCEPARAASIGSKPAAPNMRQALTALKGSI